MSSHVEVRPATTDDLSIVLSVLDEAADWLSARGIRRWPAAFDPSWILPDLRAGETWPVLAAGSPVATVTLASADRLWPNDARAGYVHRLARRRDAPNLGDAVLSWVAEQVASRGRDLIRLDCVASNQALRAYYEGRGFSHRGHVTVGGAPGDRSEAGPRTLVSLYERTVCT